MKKREEFHDYDRFVEKFKPRKTTDDCYTPPNIYDCVLEWIGKRVDLDGKTILRPFKPGGDYRREDYSGVDFVIDNPPFSIISEIVRFYFEKKIRFFLFSNGLTLLNIAKECDVSRIFVNESIIYENGAKVNTGFVTNMFGDIYAMVCPDLSEMLRSANRANHPAAELQKYEWPYNFAGVKFFTAMARAGVPFVLRKKDCHYVSKVGGIPCFGGGVLLSEKAAAEKENVIKIRLSDAETATVATLSGKTPAGYIF